MKFKRIISSSQAKINCKDNGDGSADVDYTPTVPGQYAVHILCDNDDIPGSPYMADIVPKTDYDPSKVLCFGPGVEGVVLPNVETHFTIDSTKAGKAPLDILFMDDYGEMRPLWKDENGLRDPQNGGIMAVKLIRAKELVKADMVGKSDPYAVIKHGSQKFTTKVIRNSSEPQWDFEAQVTIPDQGDTDITIELFDKDKIGKDKSLGVLTFDASKMVSQKVIEQGWYPLTGVKSGQVLLSADYVADTAPVMARTVAAAQPERKRSHKNLEVNRPLLEKKSEGIFVCTYTPRKTQKQVIWVNYGGVAVPGSPFRVTVDDPTDPSKVKVYGKGVEEGNKAGQLVDFTIDCKDAGPGDLECVILDDKDREVQCKVKDNGDHTFKAEYKPLKNGNHAISVKYDGREIPQSPINVSIKTDIDTRKIKVKGLDDEVLVDCTNEFDVDTSGLPADVTPNIACAIKTPSGSSLPSLKVDKPSNDGNVRVSYTPTQEGKHEISVTADGSPIHGSPFKVTAKKGSDPSKVIAYGPGLEKGIVNEPNQFTIETRNAGTGGLGLAIEGPAEAKMTCKDNRDGSCTVDYVPVVDGNYDISVKYDDKDIPGSPFNVPVEDPVGSSRKSSRSEIGMDGLPDGRLHINLIKARDLIKSDMVGKSDPYAVIKYGTQKFKTPVIDNTQEPRWDYEMEFNIPDGNLTEVNFEVFDSDKIGKDKSLGSVNIEISDLLAASSSEGRWYDLSGVKAGQVLLSADILEPARKKSSASLGSASQPLDDSSDSNKNRMGADGLKDGLNSGAKNNDGAGRLPEGKVKLKVVKAKELIKSDMIGKSDPYAAVKYGKQQDKTKVAKNTQEPKWDHLTEFDVPDGDSRTFSIEVLDSDKIGKDKSLGKVDLDITDILDMDGQEGRWFPLSGVKKGQILLAADFEDKLGRSAADVLDELLSGEPMSNESAKPLHAGRRSEDPDYDGTRDGSRKGSYADGRDSADRERDGLTGPNGRRDSSDRLGSRKGSSDDLGHGRKGSGADSDGRRGSSALPGQGQGGRGGSMDPFDPSNRRKASTDPDSLHGLLPDGSIPEGTAVLSVVKARGLAKADLIGKSDPYTVLKYGNQQKKSPVIKNTLEPQWDFTAEFKIPDGKNDEINLEVFDSDKIGKDKTLGSLKLPLVDVLAMDGQEGRWFPLDGSKKGEILLMADFVDSNGRDSRGNPSALAQGIPGDRRGSTDPYGSRKGSTDDPRLGRKGSNEDRDGRKGSSSTDDARRGSVNPSGSRDFDPDGRRSSTNPDGSRRDSDGSGRGGRGGTVDPLDPNSRRKGSTDPDSMHGLLPDGSIPDGTAVISIIKARGLENADILGKSDPYAELVYGRQKKSSPIVKNTLEPQWDFTAEFEIPDGRNDSIGLTVFDSDFGKDKSKDKSLGNLSLPLVDVLAMDGQDGRWFPLDGSKNGEVLLMTDFVDSNGNDSRGNPSAWADRLPESGERRSSTDSLGRKGSGDGGRRGSDSLYPGEGRKGSTDPYGSRKDSYDPYSSRKDSMDPHGSRKASHESDRPSSRGGRGADGLKDNLLSGNGGENALPSGKAKLQLVKAKDLVKSDIIGKSDPYAVVKYGRQQDKTKVVKNTQEPQWNHETEFDVPDGDSRTFNIEVFDSDKLGKDKSLGKLKMDIIDILDMDGKDGKWFPLTGVKKGQILLAADFEDELGRSAGEVLDDLLTSESPAQKKESLGSVGSRRGGANNPYLDGEEGDSRKGLRGTTDPESERRGSLGADGRRSSTNPDGSSAHDGRRSSTNPDGSRRDSSQSGQGRRGGSTDPLDPANRRKASTDPDSLHGLLPDGSIPEGTAVISVVKARGLAKADFIGKSDPYAVLVYGKQQQKTQVVKNTLEPQWDFTAEFKIPDDGDETIYLEVFDSDKIGKDKSLGSLNLPLVNVLAMDGQEGQWFPLANSKKGEILLMADFVDANGNDSRGNPSALANTLPVAGGKRSSSNLLGDRKGSDSKPQYGRKGSSESPELDEEQDGARRQSQGRKDSEPFGQGRGGRGESADRLNPNGRRKASTDPDSLHGLLPDGSIPEGTAVVSLVKARGLAKADLIGKSDPYAVLVYGKQQKKTPVIKNTLEPQWDFTAEFQIPDEDDETIYLEVFDSNKIGRDKSLGSLNLPLVDVLAMDGQEGSWFPLADSKNGEVLLMTDFVDSNGNDSRGNPSALVNPMSQDRLVDGNSGKPGTGQPWLDNLQDGRARVNLVKAKDLIKTDIVGKSDPYALMRHGSQEYKTPTVKNSQDPQWDAEVEFDIPDGDDSKIHIKIFDEDTVGKDKPMGSLDVDLADLANMNPDEGYWFPLEGVKSGQVLLTGEVMEGLGEMGDVSGEEHPSGLRRDSNVRPGQGKTALPGSRDPDGSLSDIDKAADRANKKKQALGLLGLGAIPEGQVCIDLIKAKNLENTDRNGKSDPYAVLKFGKQKAKTNTVRNTQNPQWDFSTEFEVPDGEDTDINIEVFDNDKLGRDKSLGSLSLGLDDILKAPEGEGLWYPLAGSKSGEILLASDFLPVGSHGYPSTGEHGQPIIGGKGSGEADPAKVKAYGPGLEEGKVMPGKPASFTVDSSRTGPAPLEVDLENGGSGKEPAIREIGAGKHEVTYVPPLVGEPYQVRKILLIAVCHIF